MPGKNLNCQEALRKPHLEMRENNIGIICNMSLYYPNIYILPNSGIIHNMTLYYPTIDIFIKYWDNL